MKLHLRDVNLHVDTSLVNEKLPETAAERKAWCEDALSQANNMLKRQYGISFTAFVEDADITVEN